MKNYYIALQVLIMFFLYNLIVFYIGWNGWAWLAIAWPSLPLTFYITVVLIIAYSYIFGRILHLPFFKIVGACWFAVVQYGLLILPIANIAVLFLSFGEIPLDHVIFWTGVVVLLMLIFIFSIGLYNAYQPIVRSYQFIINKKSERDSITIAVASDMHFGVLSGKSHLQRLVTKITELQPDLILLPGDIIDDDPKPFMKKKMDSIMGKLKAPLGVYGVLGNHEYYGRAIPAFVQIMKDINISILQDEIIELDDLYIIGRKDKTDKNRKEISQLVEGLDISKTLFMLDHQPSELMQAEQHGVDVILSGHTHRGQMAPNHLITKRIFELDWGYKQKSQLHAVVSSGYGFWGPPIRIGSRSEVVHITIHFQG
ncbi:metallophosphoesterase [Bacillus alkalicellulosilyticus]|uniref:metallophosphoesterase n=1 Tax=Alkalihalobacterium alkalicellulosilyticum TaxID=1912214 RepID=UPI0009971354|nr:metallophosphoesterase [Bacillus alkalicellulosilyticus]